MLAGYPVDDAVATEFRSHPDQLQRVVLIAHHGCAFYTSFLDLSQVGLVEQQREDLGKAAARVREMGNNLTVEAFFAALHEGCVLTPHAGEFARLFPDVAEKLNSPAENGPAYSKVDATRAAAARAGCVVLFKGPDTVIAAPDGRCSVNPAQYDRAAPWLATAAYCHLECARAFGPGLIAEDLPEMLPTVLRKIGV